jgi:predicted metal-dependent phosphoesterase TrpH
LAERRSVDLHLHSSISDGTDSPTDLVGKADAAGAKVIALVDHDILDGIDEARAAATGTDLELITGTELSVHHGGQKMHMLIYFLEPTPGPLQDRLGWLRRGRDERNRRIVDKLNELGYPITIDDVLDKAAGASVGRPHIGDALVEKGFFEIRDDAFPGLLGDGGVAYVERERLTALDAVSLARESGAVPVIAHPKTMCLQADDYGRLFRELTDAGLGGIEAHHPTHPLELRESLTDTAHRLGIAATGGSDYHGLGKRDYEIVIGTGDLNVPWSSVEELYEQLDR